MCEHTFSKICSEQSLQEEYRAECRICLQPLLNDYTYCDCKGASRHVHERCLVSWIKRQKSNKQQDQFSATCEICKGEIAIEVQRKCKTRKLKDTCINIFCSQNSGFRKSSTGGLLLLYMIMIALLVLMVDNYQSQPNQTYLIASILIGIVLLAFFICFCFKIFITTQWKIVTVIPREKINRRINYQIIPV